VDEWLLETLGSQAAVALQRAKLLQELAEKQRLQYELGLAREIQQALLPKRSPRLRGFQVVGWNRPADETGGDGHDFIPLPQRRLGVFLADACGHGIAPALVVSRLQTMLRVLLVSTDLEQSQIIRNVNAMLCRDLPGDHFVTAFCGILHADRAELRYCSAGQGPILHAKPAQQTIRQFNATYCPLGVVPELDFRLDQPIQFDPGDVVMLATDGFYEYNNRRDEPFGVERLADLVLHVADLNAAQILDHVREEVLRFSDGTEQKDDLTAVVIKRVT
jgi:phosphoserine phosphatase